MTADRRVSALLGDVFGAAAPLPVLRSLRGILRETAFLPAVFRRGRGPLAVFLPAKGREMSSLLRIHALAGALRPLGWGVLVIPPTFDLAQRRKVLDRHPPDVLVMQGARHPLNRPALHPGRRIVYDMDDADFHLPHLAGPVRDAMGQVDLVLAGSRYVAEWCRGQGARAAVVWTGTPQGTRPRRPHDRRAPVVAWAQSQPVDYAAERAMVLDVMARVARRRPGVRLRLFGRRPGDDPAILDPFRQAGVAVEWRPLLSYGRFLRALDDVAVGLSPVCPENPFSRGKSFGKVLAYLDRGVPVIASDAADHGLFFTPETGILSNDPEVWAAEVDRLMGDAAARQAMADAGARALSERLSTAAAAREVDRALRSVLAAVP